MLRKAILLLLIFSAVFFTHLKSRVTNFTDSRWTIHQAMSLIKEGKLTLDQYAGLVAPDDYRVYRKDGHVLSIYPAGTTLLILPIVFISDKALKFCCHFDLYDYLKNNAPTTESIVPLLEKLISSAIVALTAVFIFLISRLFLSVPKSLLLAFIFSFCTSAWSTASRSLWQHGPIMLMLAGAIFYLLRYGPKGLLVAYPALLFSCLIRPTSIIFLFGLFLYTAFTYRKRLPKGFLLLAVMFIPLVRLLIDKDFSYSYGNFFDPKVIFSQFFSLKYLGVLVSYLISPNRGLLVFSPILLFSFYGVFIKLKMKDFHAIDWLLLGIILAHFFVTLAFDYGYWGGHSFGPRYFTDIIPCLIYFLIPALNRLSALRGWKRVLFSSSFVFLMMFSFFVHFRGANIDGTWLWNIYPVDIHSSLSRAWDWQDMQFLR